MIRVAAVTSSRNDPSSRFRMRQFFDPLRAHGIETKEYCPWLSKYAPGALQLSGIGILSRLYAAAATRSADVVWLNRELVTGMETIERFMGRRRILDVDDAIWLSGNPGFALRIAARCRGVIAGNQVIADYFQHAAKNVWIVPTSVDTDRWRPATRAADETFTIGWSGTAWNYRYLYPIEKELARFLTDHKTAHLLICSDKAPEFQTLRQFEFVQWSPENEVQAVQRMDAGLMPLEDSEWTRAKCAMKMLCCMSVGVPVVASPVGAAAEILRLGDLGLAAEDWYSALQTLFADRGRAAQMGHRGREVAEAQYSVRAAIPKLAAIFQEVALASA